MDTNSLLNKWLKKMGIKDYYAMSEEEKRTYNGFKAALEGKKLTDDDVKRFWADTESELTTKLAKEDLSASERDFIIVEIRFMKKIRSFLESPDTQARNARIVIEQQL